MTLPVRMMTNSVRERFISSQFTGVRNCNKKLHFKCHFVYASSIFSSKFDTKKCATKQQKMGC